jgi:hypothetical protein
MTEFKRQKLLVEQKARFVMHDQAVLASSLDRTVERFKKEVSSTKALLTLFLAGVAFGLFRGRSSRSESSASGENETGVARSAGRLARAATLALSAVRIIDLARRADRL